MGENEINQATEEKDLGVLIDDKLKFQQHINQQTKKANQRLRMIKRYIFYLYSFIFYISQTIHCCHILDVALLCF
jgi:hypothetical protein